MFYDEILLQEEENGEGWENRGMEKFLALWPLLLTKLKANHLKGDDKFFYSFLFFPVFYTIIFYISVVLFGGEWVIEGQLIHVLEKKLKGVYDLLFSCRVKASVKALFSWHANKSIINYPQALKFSI